MREHTAEDLETFVRIATSEFPYGHLFRGVGDSRRHTLVPSIGRFLDAFEKIGSGQDEILKEEQFAFRVFVNEVAFFEHTQRTPLEYLALAQHHGLPTRLLDWTLNPLVGLFFAVWTPSATDACVYVVDRTIPFFTYSEEQDFSKHIFTYPEVRAYSPTQVSPRIRAQTGLFTYHPDPFTPLSEFVLTKITVPQQSRHLIRIKLEHLGINEKHLFPDMEGLAQWIRWHKFECVTRCDDYEMPNRLAETDQ